MSEKGGGEFLNIKYPDLQKSDQVQESVDKKLRLEHIKTPNHPIDRNEVFLDRLEHIFDNPNQSTKERNIELFKNQFLYPEVLINPDDVPDSYFKLQLKIARERGEGGDLQYARVKDVKDIDAKARRQSGEIIHNDQKKSVDNWIDYLADNNAFYPSWFRYYVLRNVVKMEVYDKEKKEFGKRSNTSVGFFPELDEEALAFTYDVLSKSYLKHEQHTDEELKRVVETANFSKIYAYAIDKVTPASKENKEKTEGEWVKFNQGDESTALYESLKGHGTGWCTAGEGTARNQLKVGDFYVYYTKDEENRNTIPRIAIRIQNGQVAEVRGINYSQNLEENMVDIAQEKYHQLPGGERFDKKDADMKRLTQIDNKVQKNEDLTEDEIIFLFELKDKIQYFGYRKDPRIKEIRSKLNILESFNKLSQPEDQKQASLCLINEISNDELSGENLDKAIDFIISKGGDQVVMKLASVINNGKLSGENLDKAIDFIVEENGLKIGDELSACLVCIFNKNNLSTENNNNLSPENINKIWKFINEEGGSETLLKLVEGVSSRGLSGENSDKAWKFISEKGKEKAAKLLIQEIFSDIQKMNERDSSYYDTRFPGCQYLFDHKEQFWEFIYKGGYQDIAASVLLAGINLFRGKDIEKAWDFIIKYGKEQTALKLKEKTKYVSIFDRWKDKKIVELRKTLKKRLSK